MSVHTILGGICHGFLKMLRKKDLIPTRRLGTYFYGTGFNAQN